MLSDRHYMRDMFRRQHSGFSTVFILIAINIAVFIVQNMDPEITTELSLSFPGLRQLKLWQLVSYMFTHGGFGHIFLNMWGLFLFGTILEPRLGSSRFLNLYFLSGFLAAGFWLLFNSGTPYILLGASGAVIGVAMATAMLFPDIQMLLLIPPVPMKLKTLVTVFILLDILSEVFISRVASTGVAHLAHLGGVLGGYLYIRVTCRDQIAWDIFSFLRPKGKNPLFSLRSHSEGGSFIDVKVSQKELDRILDKISYSGINSLTEDEMETLRKAREEMRSGRE